MGAASVPARERSIKQKLDVFHHAVTPRKSFLVSLALTPAAPEVAKCDDASALLAVNCCRLNPVLISRKNLSRSDVTSHNPFGQRASLKSF
jgi:hypothetical protein